MKAVENGSDLVTKKESLGEPPNGEVVAEPPAKAVTVYLMADGNISIEPHGFTHLELPTFFRKAAKVVEQQIIG